ncbi:hypothetical protein BS17DRAFT_769639 [Gyrodon lividus]|nr:hypothetical protein BS17DRAFT_769639 [Gyrodon lividus]
MTFSQVTLKLLNDVEKRNGVVIAWSLNPHHSLNETQVALIEKVLNEKVDQLLTRETFSKGVLWSNIKDKGGFNKTCDYSYVSREPTLALISGYWPLPVTDEGDNLRFLWTFDWEAHLAKPLNLGESGWVKAQNGSLEWTRRLLCPLCLGLPLAKAEHLPQKCDRLKLLNQKRAKDNLQEVKITNGVITWVDVPPELEVQATLHSLTAENKELKQKVNNLELKVEELTGKLEEVIRNSKSDKVNQQQEGQKKHESSANKGNRGKGSGRGGRRGGAIAA